MATMRTKRRLLAGITTASLVVAGVFVAGTAQAAPASGQYGSAGSVTEVTYLYGQGDTPDGEPFLCGVGDGAPVETVVPEDVICAVVTTTAHGLGDTLGATLTVTMPEVNMAGFDVQTKTLVDGQVWDPKTDGDQVFDMRDRNLPIVTWVQVTFDDEAGSTTDPAGLMDALAKVSDITYRMDQVTD